MGKVLKTFFLDPLYNLCMNDNDYVRDLFVRGVAAAKAKDFREAQNYLERVLELDPPPEQRVEALIRLAEICPQADLQRKWIEEALAYNPADMRARRILAVLNGQVRPDQFINPDTISHPTASAVPQKANVDRFTCPQCGGRMTFTPDGSALSCEYCEARGSKQRSLASTQSEAAENFLLAMVTGKGHLHPVNRQTFSCKGCGSEFILTAEEISAICPYCGSVYVVKNSAAHEQIDPHLMFPFKVHPSAAVEIIQRWLVQAGLPSERRQLEQGVGIYLPAWSFEMAGQVPWNCLVEEGRNRWVPLTGNEIVYHANVLVPAGKRLQPECADELTAFNMKMAVPFEETYLANWMAETYSITLGDASLEAREWTYEFEKQSVRDRFFQPVRDLRFTSTGITIESFQLVLLPVWLFHYRVGDDRYQVIINSFTGGVRGQKPLNWLERMLKRG